MVHGVLKDSNIFIEETCHARHYWNSVCRIFGPSFYGRMEALNILPTFRVRRSAAQNLVKKVLEHLKKVLEHV